VCSDPFFSFSHSHFLIDPNAAVRVPTSWPSTHTFDTASPSTSNAHERPYYWIDSPFTMLSNMPSGALPPHVHQWSGIAGWPTVPQTSYTLLGDQLGSFFHSDLYSAQSHPGTTNTFLLLMLMMPCRRRVWHRGFIRRNNLPRVASRCSHV
jgi:hypothetical protein